jgi:hypothetical protein
VEDHSGSTSGLFCLKISFITLRPGPCPQLAFHPRPLNSIGVSEKRLLEDGQKETLLNLETLEDFDGKIIL